MLEITDSQRKPAGRKLPAQQRRQQIIRVATELFSAKGFEGTTTREIAKAAGVSEAIIFRHFTTKEDLYAAIIDFLIQDCHEDFLVELQQTMDKKNDQAVFETVARQLLEAHREDPTLLRLLLFSGLEGHKLSQLFMETQVRPFYQLLSNYVAKRTREGVFRKANSLVLVRCFMGMVSHHSMIRVIFGDPFLRTTNQEMAREFARVFLNGVLIQKPRRTRGKK